MFRNLRILHNFLVFLLGGCVLASCLSNGTEEIELSNDLIISNITFGTLPRVLHTTDKQGRDSLIKTTFSATTGYPFTIDHLNNCAYNLDSLPIGVRADKILLSQVNVVNGVAGIKSLASGNDTAFATTDTLDFSVIDKNGRNTREFVLYGNDGSKRTYTVEVRIHQQRDDSVTWRKHEAEEWESRNLVTAATENSYNADGITYSINAGQMFCAVGENTPVEDAVEEDNWALFPLEKHVWAHSKARTDDNIIETLVYGTIETLVGSGESEEHLTQAVIWRRNFDLKGRYEGTWEYLPTDEKSPYPLPVLHHAGLYVYDNGYLLTGINDKGEIVVKYSLDRGRTWKDHYALLLPAELKSMKAETLKAAVDADNNLWLLIDNAELWYGRAHSVSWNEEQRSFVGQ